MKRDSIRAGRAKTFYDGLVEHLDSEGFGDFVRELCAPFHQSGSGGRPPIDPEVSFKMLLFGDHRFKRFSRHQPTSGRT